MQLLQDIFNDLFKRIATKSFQKHNKTADFFLSVFSSNEILLKKKNIL